MSVPKFFLFYVLVLLVFLVIDLLWLGFIGKGFYQKQLGHLMGEVNWSAALVFYLLYVGGIFLFAILPALEKDSLMYALGYGALFGFFCYATYDLTNLATLKSWPAAVVWVDIPWGVFLTSSVAASGFFIGRWLS